MPGRVLDPIAFTEQSSFEVEFGAAFDRTPNLLAPVGRRYGGEGGESLPTVQRSFLGGKAVPPAVGLLSLDQPIDGPKDPRVVPSAEPEHRPATSPVMQSSLPGSPNTPSFSSDQNLNSRSVARAMRASWTVIPRSESTRSRQLVAKALGTVEVAAVVPENFIPEGILVRQDPGGLAARPISCSALTTSGSSAGRPRRSRITLTRRLGSVSFRRKSDW